VSTIETWIDFSTDLPRPGSLDVVWAHGSESAKHNTDSDIQIHAYNEHTFILRQNMAVNYEAPFLFLLFGSERALLIDTGATASTDYFPLRATVDDLVDRWLLAHRRDRYGLVVLHTHAHGDHIAGDSQFADRPDTLVVPADRGGAWRFFGFDDDPYLVARVDLSGRVVECLATPGHHPAGVTFYDPYTGLLLTGDTVYRGRLYISDWPSFIATIDRLIEFSSGRSVTHILGCHIEMTRRPGVDYPVRTTYQPDEPPLQMSTDQLRDIRAAINEVGATTGRYAFDDFILCIGED